MIFIQIAIISKIGQVTILSFLIGAQNWRKKKHFSGFEGKEDLAADSQAYKNRKQEQQALLIDESEGIYDCPPILGELNMSNFILLKAILLRSVQKQAIENQESKVRLSTL